MKTIQITSKDQTDYYINAIQITHFQELTRESGTLITLSCGKKISTEMRAFDVNKLIQESSL